MEVTKAKSIAYSFEPIDIGDIKHCTSDLYHETPEDFPTDKGFNMNFTFDFNMDKKQMQKFMKAFHPRLPRKEKKRLFKEIQCQLAPWLVSMLVSKYSKARLAYAYKHQGIYVKEEVEPKQESR